MTVQTPVLFNAALGGMMAGIQSGRGSAAPAVNTPAFYTALGAAAVVFATAVDLALTAQAVITAGLSTYLGHLSAPVTTLSPVAGVTANEGESGPAVMLGLCKAAFETRELQGTAADTTASTYTAIVNDVVNAFTAYVGVANLV